MQSLKKTKPEDMLTDLPLTKSLGFAIRRKFGKTLEDARLNQEYMYQYQEMLKASQESFESFARRDERRLRRVVGDNYDGTKNGNGKFGKTLEDARLNQEYMYQYQEMLKASQESFESFARRDERRLRRVVGDHNYDGTKNGTGKFGKTLEDAHLNQEYMYQYQEMLKASQESFESFARRDERRLRRVVGDNYDGTKNGGVLDRRRNAPRFQSPVGRRRARTQALRRQKLNSQSLRSHMQHSRQTTTDYHE
ncbi:hypothetical protein PYW07_008592 [Mythimna separata]|uniref:Uncharacterized protein n=1 Tax=Mythimna separata TaxID=271217 RepID=A0AAD7YE24_MYTSE|nr:hypothetical protein PYW07_008592 [Mythimna separata]